MYDMFIPGLMIVGISGVVVFSYKIFHSRVYPVGIVRRMPTAQEEFEDATVKGLMAVISSSALSDSWAAPEPEVSIPEGWPSDKEIVEIVHLNLSEQDRRFDVLKRLAIKDYLQRKGRKVLGRGPGLRRQYKFSIGHLDLSQNPFHVGEGSPLEEEVGASWLPVEQVFVLYGLPLEPGAGNSECPGGPAGGSEGVPRPSGFVEGLQGEIEVEAEEASGQEFSQAFSQACSEVRDGRSTSARGRRGVCEGGAAA